MNTNQLINLDQKLMLIPKILESKDKEIKWYRTMFKILIILIITLFICYTFISVFYQSISNFIFKIFTCSNNS
jgi:hypothetical protein